MLRRSAPLLVFTVLLLARGAAAGETLRWRLEPDQGIVFKASGPDAKALVEGGVEERTLYGADLTRDSRGIALPVGRVQDLLWRYLLLLPEGAVDAGAAVPVDEVHDTPPFTIGIIRAQGEMRVTRRQGPVFQLETRLKLTRDARSRPEARFEQGTLAVVAKFHQKRGTLVGGDVEMTWTERAGDPPKSTSKSIKATLEPARPIDLGAKKLRSDADAIVKRAVDKELRPFIERAQYRPKGDHALGHLAIALYACTRAGLDPQSAPLAAGFEEIDKLPWKNTYSVALALLALEARSLKKTRARAGETRGRLEKAEVARTDLERMERLARWLVEARTPGRGYWDYTPFKERTKELDKLGDLSNSQFAVLALHAAARSGVKVPAEVWREVAVGFLENQEGDGPAVDLDARREGVSTGAGSGTTEREGTGVRAKARGFCYWQPGWGRYAYTSMSAAGVSSLWVARQNLRALKALDADLEARLDGGIRDGLAFLQRAFAMRRNWPDYEGWPLYCIYSLEKAFELARVERLGGHDWWIEGVQELALREKPLGGFGAEPYETALAVLFLTRATQEPEIEVRDAGPELSGGPARPEDEDAVTLEGVGLVSATQVVRAVEVRDTEKRKERIELATRAIAALDEEKRPVVVPALAKLLGAASADVRRFAEDALRKIAGAKLDSEEAAVAFHRDYLGIRASGQGADFDRIPDLRARLKADGTAPALRRAAILALSRLGALEAVPEMIGELERAPEKDRAWLRALLAGTVGQDHGEDPAKWRAEWAWDPLESTCRHASLSIL